MNDERFERVSRIFLGARALSAGERGAYVARECAGDRALRTEVEAMLRGADRPSPFATLADGLAGVRERLRADAAGAPPAREPAGGHTPPAGSEDERGARIGPYTLVERIGEGGFGSVYRAEQERPVRRSVALKLIKPGMDSARVIARFEAERQALALMDHPGIARVYDAGTTDEGRPYFVMELVEGGVPITACCDGRRMGVRERLALFVEVCRAVQHAHQKGIIHRDIKPSNVLVRTIDGVPAPKVIDFGIAKATDPRTAWGAGAGVGGAVTMQTAEGQVIGTPAYMSPEQVASAGRDIDTRTDVYSLGVLLYELLAGATPFDPTTVRSRSPGEMERHIRETEPLRPSVRVARSRHPSAGTGGAGAPTGTTIAEVAEARATDAPSLRRALAGDLDWIVMKCLEKDRARRYDSAIALAADVDRHLRDEAVLARPPSTLYRAHKFVRRHRAGVAAGGLVTIALVGATAVSTWQARVAIRALGVAESEKQRADESAAAALRGARRATLAAAAAAIDSGDPIAARRLLDGMDERVRGWAWGYWRARLDQSVAMVTPGGEGGRIAGAWMSPGGDEIAAITEDGIVRRGSPWSGQLAEVARVAEAPVDLAVFADEGLRIIAACGHDRRTLAVFDAADGALVERVADLEARAGLLEASRDAAVICTGVKRIGGSYPADDVWVWRLADGPAPPHPRAWEGGRVQEGGRTSGLALTRDGGWLAFGSQSVRVVDVPPLTLSEFGGLQRSGFQYAITDDGALVATGGEDKIIRVWDRRTGAQVRSMTGHSGNITALAFDASGAVLASAARDLTIRLWEAHTGAGLATFTGHTGEIRRLEFAREGERALLMSVSLDGSIRLWRRDPLEGACVLRGHTSYVYAAAFTPDGSRIFSGAWDKAVRAWDGAGGGHLAAFPAEQGFVTVLAVSPDGGRIATGHKVDDWAPGPVCMWDATSGVALGEVARGLGGVCDLVFSADGARLWAAWDNDGVEEINITGTPPARRRMLERTEPRSIALSPDGVQLACGHADGSITILGATSGEVLRRLEGGEDGHRAWVGGVAFCPSPQPLAGRLLASASADGTARLWDADSGRCLAVLEGHWDHVYAASFSPDGGLLATGSEDTTIALWDVADALAASSPGGPGSGAEPLTRLRGHEAYVYSLAFSPDGTRLVSASGDHTLRVWDTRPVHERWRARMAREGGGGAR